MNGSELILKAKAQLLFKHPFFATLLLHLKFKEESGIPTMDVNGITLRYNMSFVESLTIDELIGVFAHEVMHCALQHPIRHGKRNLKKWGRAIDYAVNPLVLDAGLILPDGALLDSTYRNMTANHIYDLLPDSDQEDEDFNDFGGVMEPTNDQGDELNEGEVKQLQGQWKMAVNDATKIAKEQGKMPGNLEELVEKLNESKIPWQQKMRALMTDPAKGDYMWSRPNRRHIWNNLYLPTNFTHKLGTIVWVTDSSGSIGKKEFEQFGGEFNAIIEDTQPSSVWAMFCDTSLHEIEEYTEDDFPIASIRPVGRGGTSFNAPFEWVEKQGIDPACLVYLTDLYGDCTVDTPPYPVLWVCTSPVDTVPFGEITHIEV